MKVIELSGLPGCGKTTLTQAIIKKLGNCKFLTYEDIMTSSEKMTNPYLSFFISFFTSEHLKVNILILRYAFSYTFKVERMRFVKTLIIFNKAVSEAILEKKADFIILEEGIIQLLTSIPHENEIKINSTFLRLIRRLNEKYNMTVLFVCCFLENGEVIKRLSLRSKPNDRFDVLSSEALKEILGVKLRNLGIVQKRFKVLNIDMSMPFDTIVSELFKDIG